ncbi:hypothetical protein HCX49_03680 [Sphingobacterium kitahiroshimense]|uniref:hypothetical protein n=1 Tax=Sphingobacterium sp. B16(2022) TaxID=2914044 RepID=UPI00143B5831|nr:hypothetical protein [Sphingobacterium sp. B16(2022)]NJI72296.1 hypothetical protein [Sphingobacterium sp. B16(2022)]
MIGLQEFHDTILQVNVVELISYIKDNRNPLKLLFINLEVNQDNSAFTERILVFINSMQLSNEQKGSDEIQFLFKELGLYFMRANVFGSALNCSNNIKEHIFKNRLKAWMHYKMYRKVESHCKLFDKYLKKLSTAITNGVEDYENDVLRDLHVYYEQTVSLMEEKNREAELVAFKALFEDVGLVEEYPLLASYQENKYQFTATIEIGEEIPKIYEPSDFTDDLFEEKFLRYIKAHPDTRWHEILLGYRQFIVRREIIKFGQAHFDDPYRNLSANDVVKLYSYFNMRKHYYSSLHLLERFRHIADFHGTNGRIKFIDVGCGPATSGIALVDYLHTINGGTVSFDYFGVDHYRSMRQEAEYMMQNVVYENTDSTFFMQSLGDIDFECLENANSIFINTCYLFASDNLNEEKLAVEVLNVKRSKRDVPFYILFQNTTDPAKNVKYENFKRHLNYDEKPLLRVNSWIRYNNRRNSLYMPTEELVYFEILKIE